MAKKKAPETKDDSLPQVKSKWRRFFILSLKLTAVFLVIIGFYTLYLDSKVVAKFEGQRWQIPVQVFGKVEHFQKTDKINFDHLKENLTLTGYQRVAKVSQPGQFALSSRRAIIYRRAFDFGSGVEDSQKIQIDVNRQGQYLVVSQLFVDNQPAVQVTLEPFLMDRMVPENKEDRVLVPLQSVPEKLLDTLLLVEDRDFYFHYGVSPLGILRALYTNLKAGRTVQGGSTLTQQLVKNMYLTRDKTIWRKVNEAIMALLLEYRYSKDQLLEAYINEVYLGQHFANGIYGFGLAAEFYFGKNVAQLTDEQMATLIGVIKGPSYYDPWRYQERVKKRRDLILKLMFEHDFLSKAEYLTAVKSGLSVKKSRRLQQNKQKFPAYLQLVKRELTQLLSAQDQASGIRVFTSFSPFTQQLAQQSVTQQLVKLAKKEEHQLQAAMIVSDHESGAIKAVIGDKKAGYAGFNRALNAKRPIGSLIKPAIYIAALERFQQYQLATILDDKAISFETDSGEVWQPKNYDGKFRGSVSVLESLTRSLNIPTVNLGMELGLENIADIIHMLGYDEDITLRPSMLLGAINMSPYQVNQFYQPFANQGYFAQNYTVERVVSPLGETLYQHESDQIPYFSEQASYLTDYALTKVTINGSAKSLSWRLKDKGVAGKTGTTNDQRDSWFVGYDDKHLVTTWLGRDDNKATDFTGSSGALTVFARFMKLYGVVNKLTPMPSDVELLTFEEKSGYPLAVDCKNTYQLPAVSTGLAMQYSCSEGNKKPKKKRSWFEKIFG